MLHLLEVRRGAGLVDEREQQREGPAAGGGCFAVAVVELVRPRGVHARQKQISVVEIRDQESAIRSNLELGVGLHEVPRQQQQPAQHFVCAVARASRLAALLESGLEVALSGLVVPQHAHHALVDAQVQGFAWGLARGHARGTSWRVGGGMLLLQAHNGAEHGVVLLGLRGEIFPDLTFQTNTCEFVTTGLVGVKKSDKASRARAVSG